jgi:hypothetical protein
LGQSTYGEVVTVRGSVLEFNRHRPIAGAIVYARSEADVRITTSDKNGTFYFLSLLPGNYSFSASKQGYSSQCLCCRQDPQELDAGFEYLASAFLFNVCY